MHNFKVAVVGAGPAGCSAALVLARAGFRTILIEKSPLPRSKTCGGGLVLRARKFLDIEIDAVVEDVCHRVNLFFNDLELSFSITRNYPIITTVMRDKFDYLLTQKAADAGASIQSECLVEKITQDGKNVLLHTRNDQIRSEWVILAEGAGGHLAKNSGWSESRLLLPGLECELTTPDAEFKGFSNTARFDFGFIPAGYAWIFPKKKHLSVGVLCMKKGTANLRKYLAAYLQHIFAENFKINNSSVFFIPIIPRRDLFVRDRILLVGDSAGLADPISGEGISNAILSGQLAARALIETESHPKKICQLYTNYLKEHILKDLKLARKLAHIFYFSPRIRNRIFRRYGNEMVRGMTSVLSGEHSYSDLIYDPRSYLKLVTHYFRLKN